MKFKIFPFGRRKSLTIDGPGAPGSYTTGFGPTVAFQTLPLGLLDELGMAGGEGNRIPSPLQQYLLHPGVRGGVDAIARNVAQLPLIAEMFDGVALDQNPRPLAVNNSLSEMLRDPDPSQPVASWKFGVVVDLLVHGEALAVMLGGASPADNGNAGIRGGTRPTLIRLDPALTTVEGTGGNISGYTVGGKTYAPEEVWHCLIFNPMALNRNRGLSPLWALRHIVAEDLAASQYRLKTWAGANPGGWIERPVDAPQLNERGRTRLAEAKKATRPDELLLMDEGMKLHNFEPSAAAADFSASREYVVTMIASVLGIPVASDRNVSASNRNFYTDAIAPICNLIEESLNLQVVPRVLGETQTTAGRIRVRFDLDDKLAGSYFERSKVNLAATGNAGWLTQNEVRAKEGLPPLEGGDVLPPFKTATPANPEGGAQ